MAQQDVFVLHPDSNVNLIDFIVITRDVETCVVIAMATFDREFIVYSASLVI